MMGRGVMGVVKAIAPNMVVFMVFDVIQNAFQAVSINFELIDFTCQTH